jgi:hypothetical protein
VAWDEDEIWHQNVQDCEKWLHARYVAGTAAELDTIALELARDGLGMDLQKSNLVLNRDAIACARLAAALNL